jgi:hypothetical protein
MSNEISIFAVSLIVEQKQRKEQIKKLLNLSFLRNHFILLF